MKSNTIHVNEENKKESEWIVRCTETCGDGETMEGGEMYYVNRFTGEQTWNQPRELTEKHHHHHHEIEISNLKETFCNLKETIEALHVSPEQLDQQYFDIISNVEQVIHQCWINLTKLRYLFTEAKSEEEQKEWITLIQHNDMEWPRILLNFVDQKIPEKIHQESTRLLLLFEDKIDIFSKVVFPDLLEKLFQAIALRLSLTGASCMITLSNDNILQGIEDVVLWLAFVETLCTKLPLSSTQGLYTFPAVHQCIVAMFDLLPVTPSQVYLKLARAIMSINWHMQESSINVVTKVLLTHSKSELLGEGVVYLVHSSGNSSYHHQGCLKNALQFISDILGDKSTWDFFYTNDLKVLVDIIIRQVTDLPLGDQMRWRYLDVLYKILLYPGYTLQGKYRNQHILVLLENLLSSCAEEDSGMHTQAEELIKIILVQCIDVLD